MAQWSTRSTHGAGLLYGGLTNTRDRGGQSAIGSPVGASSRVHRVVAGTSDRPFEHGSRSIPPSTATAWSTIAGGVHQLSRGGSAITIDSGSNSASVGRNACGNFGDLPIDHRPERRELHEHVGRVRVILAPHDVRQVVRVLRLREQQQRALDGSAIDHA